eukprot:TRINITY_DN2427_c0_g2_i1.p1 TRINITY_DN2427_c0_g2~~TRINITY_DN2427_c0_g2_i1.p1  ORF type:complete len:285 (-),score=78.33 TRINITY_DN2427_c0_g2_i1:52-843(-)
MPTVKIDIAHASTLTKIIKSLSEVVKEANFLVSESGIALQCMDSSQVSIVFLVLECGEELDIECEEQFTLGLNLKDVLDALKCANNDDRAIIQYDEKLDSGSVTFIFKGKSQISEFTLRLFDIEDEQVGVPEIEYQSVVTMPSSELQRIGRDLRIWGENVVISTSKDGTVKFTVEGERGVGTLSKMDDDSVDIKSGGVKVVVDEPVSLTFGLNYINNFTKATPLSDTVELGLSEGIPLSVKYTIGDLGHINYHLAPQMTEDDD